MSLGPGYLWLDRTIGGSAGGRECRGIREAAGARQCRHRLRYVPLALAFAAKPSRTRSSSAIKVDSSVGEKDADAARNREVFAATALPMTASPLEVKVARSCRRSSRSTEDFTKPSRSRAAI